MSLNKRNNNFKSIYKACLEEYIWVISLRINQFAYKVSKKLFSF
jgi:hypothetical protein